MVHLASSDRVTLWMGPTGCYFYLSAFKHWAYLLTLLTWVGWFGYFFYEAEAELSLKTSLHKLEEDPRMITACYYH